MCNFLIFDFVLGIIPCVQWGTFLNFSDLFYILLLFALIHKENDAHYRKQEKYMKK